MPSHALMRRTRWDILDISDGILKVTHEEAACGDAACSSPLLWQMVASLWLYTPIFLPKITPT